MSGVLDRVVFDTPRAAEFLERRALQAQTGQQADRFGDVVVKELVDNALDAAETTNTQPEVTVLHAVDGDVQRITVKDNGPGIPAEVVQRILNFDVLVSDKAAYRSPTRGVQGNAWKTLLGIPYALEILDPVVVEAQGIRHEIAVSMDPGGNVVIRHDRTDIEPVAGTTATVPLPPGLDVDAAGWVQRFAALNPHATLAYLDDCDVDAAPEIYKPTAGDGWRKPLPTDKTSPHWYDETALKRLVFAHIRAIRGGVPDVPLGRFVRSFEGLTSTAKAKAVAGELPGVERLSDFETDPDRIAVLLAAMQSEAKILKPTILGSIGEDHLRAFVAARCGIERFWYRRRRLAHDGLPWVFEVAVAETSGTGTVIEGVNYSVSFGDPLGRTTLRTEDRGAISARSFLGQADAWPDVYDNDLRRAVVLHLVCPALEFVDKGKVSVAVPDAVAQAFAETPADATKPLHREHKRAERDALAARKRSEREARRASNHADREAREDRVTLKDAVFSVMEEAIAHTSGNGAYPFPTRNLMYSVRARVQALTDAELTGSYFSQTLVVEWEQTRGRIPGHYREPRGELFEPHTGNSVRLGTREVATYVLPKYLYDKVLYVEKQGFDPIFLASKLADRFDMAIASGKGQPVEAVRELFERAAAGAYKLFVLHDADHDGYTIARAMAEETARMPGYSVDVIDLGLTVETAMERGLPTEKYTRRKQLPRWMPERLTENAHAWFSGREIGRKQWECTRVELNALSGPELIELVEQGLAENGATGKVVPPDSVIKARARTWLHEQLRELVDKVVAEIFDPEVVATSLAAEHAEIAETIERDTIVEHLTERPHLSWNASVNGAIGGEIFRRGDELRDRVRALLAQQGIGDAQ